MSKSSAANEKGTGTGLETGDQGAVELVEERVADSMHRALSADAGERKKEEGPAEAAVSLREVVSVVLLVGWADWLIYRGGGFAGYAAFFAGAGVLLLCGAPRLRLSRWTWATGALLLLVSARMVWEGSGLLFVGGLAVLAAFSMTLAGLRPYVMDVLVYFCHTLISGAAGLWHYSRSSGKVNPDVSGKGGLSVVLPLIALAGFGTLFVLANPDMATFFSERLSRLGKWLWEAVSGWNLKDVGEIFFCGFAAWIAVGLLRPMLKESVLSVYESRERKRQGSEESVLYPAFRNTLAALIGLFGVYLVFEFKTLWFRDFPEGFYYAGYAHEGAAWLTAALALATLVLSGMFRGKMMRDERLPRLRKLAWVWSAMNLVLALAVYNRLFIYIDFNGMTRMRTVGLLGISSVVVGFVLVVWKITQGRDFVWLLRRQLWTVAVAGLLFVVLPVDWLVHTYNVRRILAGDLAPSVQISVHPIDTTGVLALPGLTECENEIIREGIRAMLAERAVELEGSESKGEGWKSFQMAEAMLRGRLEGHRSEWEKFAEAEKREAALARFGQYAYQWY